MYTVHACSESSHVQCLSYILHHAACNRSRAEAPTASFSQKPATSQKVAVVAVVAFRSAACLGRHFGLDVIVLKWKLSPNHMSTVPSPSVSGTRPRPTDKPFMTDRYMLYSLFSLSLRVTVTWPPPPTTHIHPQSGPTPTPTSRLCLACQQAGCVRCPSGQGCSGFFFCLRRTRCVYCVVIPLPSHPR